MAAEKPTKPKAKTPAKPKPPKKRHGDRGPAKGTTKTKAMGRRPGGGRPKGALSKKISPCCKLTQKIVDDFCAIVARGNWRTVACQRLNISVNTYKKWMSQGKQQLRDVESGKRKKILLQGEFVLGLQMAEGRIHGEMVEDILDHGSIQARQWYLEKRWPKLYGRGAALATTTDDETGEDVQESAISLLAERLKALVDGKED